MSLEKANFDIDLKMLKNIKLLSISQIGIFILFAIFLSLCLGFSWVKTTNQNFINMISSFGIVFITFASLYLLFSIINASIVMCFSWELKIMHVSKLAWGLLGLFLLGPIASLVFSIMWTTDLNMIMGGRITIKG